MATSTPTTIPTTAPASQATTVAPHAAPIRDLEQALETRPGGLSQAEVAARLERYGPNQLDETPPTSKLQLILHQFKSPLIYILLVAAVVTLALQEYIDVAVIMAVLILNAIIGYTQEEKAESSVRALAKMVTPHAHVIRNGHEREIDSRELVPGDVVLLESGARAPADIRLTATTALRVDESPLTGESLPVTKAPGEMPETTVLADRTNMVFAGTTTTSGRGRGYVVRTGTSTELGSISTQVREATDVQSPLELRMVRFARMVGLAVGGAVILAFMIGFLRGEPAADIFMVAVALAVSAIPEGLPVATTIALAVGVRRMAKRNAIVRHLPAVETLGSTTTIGSDKTGTLTENRMTVQQVWAGGRFVEIGADGGGDEASGPVRRTLLTGSLTNEAEIEQGADGWSVVGDPTEGAILVAANACGIDIHDARRAFESLGEIPFEPERQYSASIRDMDGTTTFCVKGAPERILAMSASMLGDDGPEPLDHAAVHAAADALAARGLRVLAMAYADTATPDGSDDVPEPSDLVLAGLVGMLDPPREGVREAIAATKDAGVRTVMITGDHASTATAIGRQLGIPVAGAGVLTGAEMRDYDDDRLREAARRTSIYARVSPEQKLQVVQAMQANGEVVAVTGDGVNDAPALKSADIGIAMGRSGTDVARESSDMVLTDDNFVSIVAAVEEGRVTFDNIRKVTYFLISTGAAEVLMILVALLMGWPLPLLAAQILWLNLVTNGLQDVALAFEPGDPNALKRPPRRRADGIVSRVLVERMVIVAIVMAAGTLGVFNWVLERSDSLVQAQTAALTTMVVFQVFQAGNSRSEYRSVFRIPPFSNPFLFIATAAAISVHTLALYLSPTQFVLRVEPIGAEVWIRIILVASTVLIVSELHKLLRRSPNETRQASKVSIDPGKGDTT